MPATAAAAAAKLPLARRALAAKSSLIRDLLKVTQRPDIISFAGGLPAPETFPVEALRVAFDGVLREGGAAALQYSATEGYPPLREWIAARETARGMPTSAEQVLIVSGSQQGLDLIGKAMIDEGSPVLVEAPTYLGALQSFAQFGAAFVELPADENGLRAEGLRAGGGARFAYVMPNFQNPTGRSLSIEQREQLAAAARRHDFWLVEDDPYGELWYREAPPPGMRAFAPERTIRLGSFSKVLAPGLRIGFLIAPRAMIDTLVRLKQATDLHTATLAQQGAWRVLDSGLLDTHLPAVRARYASQCAVMIEALAASWPGAVQFTRPAGGMFVWAALPRHIDTMRLLDRAIERQVLFVPGAAFFADEGAAPAHMLRLSFVTVPPERIRAGVRVLGELIAEVATQT
ncbi:MAG TPA: PLP-dependent aminotransferase family protein [Burkholderiaceae bacterium]|nr:PLP-dependent aminotransferase family protein [Burkholderiaceae bacterium]